LTGVLHYFLFIYFLSCFYSHVLPAQLPYRLLSGGEGEEDEEEEELAETEQKQLERKMSEKIQSEKLVSEKLRSEKVRRESRRGSKTGRDGDGMSAPPPTLPPIVPLRGWKGSKGLQRAGM
jgi:hypothetical protein